VICSGALDRNPTDKRDGERELTVGARFPAITGEERPDIGLRRHSGGLRGQGRGRRDASRLGKLVRLVEGVYRVLLRSGGMTGGAPDAGVLQPGMLASFCCKIGRANRIRRGARDRGKG
jgi:hypothetical protein